MSSNWSCGLVECSFVNLIERVSKKLTSFCWMSENDERKTFLTEKIFTTNCCNAQTDSSFDDTAEKFLSESQEEIRSSFNDEQKKNLFEKKSLQQISLTSGNQFWQNCYLFSDRKYRLFFVQCFRRMKKHTKKFQSRCLSSKWSFGLLERSVVHLAEKKFEQTLINLRSMSENNGENIFDEDSFRHKLAKLTNRKQYW